jgi:hypothetical protein
MLHAIDHRATPRRWTIDADVQVQCLYFSKRGQAQRRADTNKCRRFEFKLLVQSTLLRSPLVGHGVHGADTEVDTNAQMHVTKNMRGPFMYRTGLCYAIVCLLAAAAAANERQLPGALPQVSSCATCSM